MINVDLITKSYRGYEYFIDKGPMGTPNGYVMIRPNQKGYHQGNFTNSTIECHGDITFDSNAYGQLNVPTPKNARVIGFDTNHAGDYNPVMAKHMPKIPLDPMTKKMYKKHPEMAKFSPLRMFGGRLAHHWTKPELYKQCKLIIDQLIKGDYKFAEI